MVVGQSNIDNSETRGGGTSVAIRKEPRVVRPCPKCLEEWPFDWEYCANCAISLQGREITREFIRFVPSESCGPVEESSINAGAKHAAGLFLACDFRCDAGSPGPEDFRRAKTLMDIALGAIASHNGAAWLLADVGIVGCWDDVAANIDMAVRAATETLKKATPREPRWGLARVSLGIGAVSLRGWSKPRSEALNLAFRLASLARPNGALVNKAVYSETVARFDYCGVCPTVPKSEPLPEPVFTLIGAKPEISGTHQTVPDTILLVGRDEVINVLDSCCADIAGGRLVVLHLIGEPGMGKSRLLREWLNDTARQSEQTEWIRLYVHGVPYGSYPLRAWKHLVKPITDSTENVSVSLPELPATVEDVITQLRRLNHPALIIVDDLHWIDDPSRRLLASFLEAATRLPVFVILAYRSSFINEAPYGILSLHRRVLLGELGRAELKQLIDAVARDRGIDLPCEGSEAIIRKAQGNPLYAIEAIGYLSEAGGNVSPASLPSSVPELLIQRIQRTVDLTLPRLEQEVRLCMLRFASVGDPKHTLRRLELLEEQVAAWLDRFDVFQQEPPAVVRKFLCGLKEIDGTLALLSIFLGRQRPHQYRLAQALARVEGLDDGYK